MTRQELLDRLIQMKNQGQNMGLPVILTIDRQIPDRRKSDGYRKEQTHAVLKYACGGSLSCITVNGQKVTGGQLWAPYENRTGVMPASEILDQRKIK